MKLQETLLALFRTDKQVFQVNKHVGLPPQLELLARFHYAWWKYYTCPGQTSTAQRAATSNMSMQLRVHMHTSTHSSPHTYPILSYVFAAVNRSHDPPKGGSKTRVHLLGRLRLFSWAIADWSSCLTPLCKDGSYDGKFTGRGASSPQGKSSRDALSGAIGRCPGLWLLGVLGNSGSCPT